MHPNQVYRQSGQKEALEFVRDVGFRMLTVNGDPAPIISHVPFVPDGDRLLLHLIRSNPMARLDKDTLPAKFVVSGPHGYISPDWYDLEDQVPTWNYIAVHMEGKLERMHEDDLKDVLEKLSDSFERRLAPKPVWKTHKVSDDAMASMMRMLVPFTFLIEGVESTYKLSQNKPSKAILGAADGVSNSLIGSETGALAKHMRKNLKRNAKL